MKKTTWKVLYVLLTVSVLLGFVLSIPSPVNAADPDQMEVHFMDVGQGDATLVTCGGHAMLIDAGDDTKGTAIQNYLQKQKITRLDYLILTHPDADHIGGAPVIITKIDIGKVFVSNFEKDNKTYQKLIQSLDDKQIKPLTPRVNSQYTLGTANITILAPGKSYDNPNDASIALLLKNGTRSFLFTGDAGEDAEKDILKTGIDISADVYKVGHHGSKYSTSKDFFNAVDPFYAVISCGENNSYGHPHAETLNTLRTSGVMVYRTDEAGTIVASTDGKSISFNVPASESWKAGEPTGSGSDSSAKSMAPAKTAASAQTQKTAPAAASPKETPADTGQTASPAASGQTSEPASPPQRETAPAVEETPQDSAPPVTSGLTYVLNVKTKKFHRVDCKPRFPFCNRDSPFASGIQRQS